MFTIYDSFGDEVGKVDGLDAVPEWDGLGRTARQIAVSNDGWIQDASGVTVFEAD